MSREDADVYAEGVRRGGTLVSARVPDGERTRYEAILDRSAVNIADRREAYRQSGWTRFDETAPSVLGRTDPARARSLPPVRQHQSLDLT